MFRTTSDDSRLVSRDSTMLNLINLSEAFRGRVVPGYYHVISNLMNLSEAFRGWVVPGYYHVISNLMNISEAFRDRGMNCWFKECFKNVIETSNIFTDKSFKNICAVLSQSQKSNYFLSSRSFINKSEKQLLSLIPLFYQ